MHGATHSASALRFEDTRRKSGPGKAENVQVWEIRTGKSLFHEGDVADYIYEIVSGVARSSKVLADGRRQILFFGYPGTIMGVSDGASHDFDCTAITPLKVHAYNKTVFRDLMTEDGAFCRRFMDLTASEMRRMHEHFITLGRKSASEKLASFLCALMDQHGVKAGAFTRVPLPMKQTDIADFLGLTVETVSRVMSGFKRDSTIAKQSPKTIDVLDERRLRAVAEQSAD
ncbi:MAG: helix-turn-helix domain-containing protein [Pseudomonadota bacterium]